MTQLNALWLGTAGQSVDTRSPPSLAPTNVSAGSHNENACFRTGNSIYYPYGAPVTANATNICAAQAIAGAGNALINGALATAAGVAILDVGRCVALKSSSASDTAVTVIVSGTDLYGVALTSKVTLNGTTAVLTLKAFKTVTQVAVSGAMVGNLSVGTSDTFGLPYVVTTGNQILPMFNGALITSYTLVTADATIPATNLTGDVRGTILSGSITSNSTAPLSLFMGMTFPAINAINTTLGVPNA